MIQKTTKFPYFIIFRWWWCGVAVGGGGQGSHMYTLSLGGCDGRCGFVGGGGGVLQEVVDIGERNHYIDKVWVFSLVIFPLLQSIYNEKHATSTTFDTMNIHTDNGEEVLSEEHNPKSVHPSVRSSVRPVDIFVEWEIQTDSQFTDLFVNGYNQKVCVLFLDTTLFLIKEIKKNRLIDWLDG